MKYFLMPSLSDAIGVMVAHLKCMCNGVTFAVECGMSEQQGSRGALLLKVPVDIAI